MKWLLMWQWREDRNVLGLCALSTESRRVHFQSLAILGVDSVPVLWEAAMNSVEKTEIYRMLAVSVDPVHFVQSLPAVCAADNLQKEPAAVADFDRSIAGSATVVDLDALAASVAPVAVVSRVLVVFAPVLLAAFVAPFLVVVVGNVVAFVVHRVVAVVELSVAVNRARAVVTEVEILVLASGMEESVPVRDDRSADLVVRSAATVVFSLVLVAAAQYKN